MEYEVSKNLKIWSNFTDHVKQQQAIDHAQRVIGDHDKWSLLWNFFEISLANGKSYSITV